jgi:hypothetical protein
VTTSDHPETRPQNVRRQSKRGQNLPTSENSMINEAEHYEEHSDDERMEEIKERYEQKLKMIKRDERRK